MRRTLALVTVGALVLLAFLYEPAESKLRPSPPPAALRYPDVHPIFVKHCASCHDSRIAKNPAAQAVFEMTSYPFSTKRPATLVGDLRDPQGALRRREGARPVVALDRRARCRWQAAALALMQRLPLDAMRCDAMLASTPAVRAHDPNPKKSGGKS